MLYKPLLHCNNYLKQFSRISVLKVGVVDVDICISSHLKKEQAWAADKQLWVISTIMLFIVLIKELNN